MATYRDTVMANSPAAYWRFGELSGTAAADEIGTYGGVYTGSPTLGVASLLTGDANPAVTLNGSSQYVALASAPTFTTGGFSMEVWLAFSDTEKLSQVIFGFYDLNSPYTGWGFGYNLQGSANHRFALWTNSGALWREYTTATLTGNARHHILLTFAAGAGSQSPILYIDGVSQTASQNPPGSYTGAKSLGSSGAGNYFKGTMDEMAVYNSVLTPTQVAAHYAAGTAPTGIVLPSLSQLRAVQRASLF